MKTRGLVASAGTFGFELDPAKLSEEERKEVRAQIRFYREHEALIREGDYVRLSDPAAAPFCAWAFVSGDRREALICAVLQEKHGNMSTQYVRLRGLEPGTFYRDRESGAIYPSDALMDAGLPLLLTLNQYDGVFWHLEQC